MKLYTEILTKLSLQNKQGSAMRNLFANSNICQMLYTDTTVIGFDKEYILEELMFRQQA